MAERDDDFEGFDNNEVDQEQDEPRLPDPPPRDEPSDEQDSPERGEGEEAQAGAESNAADDDRPGESPKKDRAKKRIQQLAQQRNELAGKLDEERRQREALEARLAKLEEKESSSLETRLKDLEARRKAAIEDGEIEDAILLGDELADLRFELRQRPKRAEPAEAKPPAAEPPRARQTQQASNVPPATARWIERNSEWIHAQPAKLQLAARLEAELIQSGEYEANSDDLYDALDEVLEERMRAGQAPKPRTQSFASTGAPNEPGTTRQARGNRLTRDDIARMRAFNLDPSNPAHAKAWLKRNEPL